MKCHARSSLHLCVLYISYFLFFPVYYNNTATREKLRILTLWHPMGKFNLIFLTEVFMKAPGANENILNDVCDFFKNYGNAWIFRKCLASFVSEFGKSSYSVVSLKTYVDHTSCYSAFYLSCTDIRVSRRHFCSNITFTYAIVA